MVVESPSLTSNTNTLSTIKELKSTTFHHRLKRKCMREPPANLCPTVTSFSDCSSRPAFPQAVPVEGSPSTLAQPPLGEHASPLSACSGTRPVWRACSILSVWIAAPWYVARVWAYSRRRFSVLPTVWEWSWCADRAASALFVRADPAFVFPLAFSFGLACLLRQASSAFPRASLLPLHHHRSLRAKSLLDFPPPMTVLLFRCLQRRGCVLQLRNKRKNQETSWDCDWWVEVMLFMSRVSVCKSANKLSPLKSKWCKIITSYDHNYNHITPPKRLQAMLDKHRDERRQKKLSMLTITRKEVKVLIFIFQIEVGRVRGWGRVKEGWHGSLNSHDASDD